MDSSWIDAENLRPLRVHSSNTERVVSLEFDGRRVRGGTRPATGPATSVDASLAARPFEWNTFGLALSALPLRQGFRAIMPVYSDRAARIVWYAVEVVRDTSLLRASGYRSPMWEVVATGDSAAPSARFWVSRNHRLVDQVLVWEPGASIMYRRELGAEHQRWTMSAGAVPARYAEGYCPCERPLAVTHGVRRVSCGGATGVL